MKQQALSSSSFKQHFEEWCQVTTCAGIIDWHLSKTIFCKIFWSILLSIGLALTIWQTTLVLQHFINDNHYQTTLSVNSGEPLKFPNVTICNFNRVNQRKIGVGVVDKDVMSYIFQAASVKYYKLLDVPSNLIDNFENRWNETKQKLKINDTEQLFRKFGYSCHEVFLECQYEYTKFNCCDYAMESITGNGRCWTVLSKSFEYPENPNVQNSAGIDYGMEVILNPMINTYLKNVVKNNYLEIGFMISISFEDQLYAFDYQSVQPGYHYWMKLKPTLYVIKSEVIPIWPRNCRSNEELSILEASYSKANCEGDCWAKMFVEKCNCSSTFAPLKKNYRVCNNREYLECTLPLCQDNRKFCTERVGECRKECKNPCNQYWRVETTQTSAKFINDHNFDELSNNWSKEQLSAENDSEKNESIKNLIRLEIFYPTLDYIQIETGEMYPLFTFIGNIGGQLSLLLGMSIVTIIQAVCYLCSCGAAFADKGKK